MSIETVLFISQGIPLDEEFFTLKDILCQKKVIRVHYDDNVHLGTSDITRETDGTFLDNFNPVLVMYEYMKKDNLRVIDFFQVILRMREIDR